MMKTKLIIPAAILFWLSSCHDVLDVQPKTFSSGANYYQTESQIKSAVNGVYGQLQLLYTGDFWAMTEMRSDNTTYQFNEGDRGSQQREEIDEFLITSDNNYIETIWSQLYSGIQQANVILHRIEQVKFSDPVTKIRLIGETKFLRAFYYFHLVRLFGPVPLLVEEVEDPDEAFTGKRASIEEVYAQIIQDTKDAVNSLPVRYEPSEAGRATKGAALTLLGDIYLTRQQYPEAVAALQQVTLLHYALVQDYAEVFDPDHKNNIESVFEIQYNAAVEGESSNFFFTFGPIDASEALTGYKGLLGGNNIPTFDMIDAYEAGDLRRKASIGYYANPVNTQYQEAVGDTIPYIKKYYHPPFELEGQTNENWPVYRYAGGVLMLDEALNETGQTSAAYHYLNEVRNRAGLPPVAGLSQEAFRDAVYHEERVELAFENQRWYDLLRTGRAVTVMNRHGVAIKQRIPRLSVAAYEVPPYKLLYPIPEREIRLNGFEQNPGW